MDALVACFIDIVSTYRLRVEVQDGKQTGTSERELAINIGRIFTDMTRLYQQGMTFDPAGYADLMQRRFDATDDTTETWALFREYNRFLVLILDSKEHPGLLARFRDAGLGQWAELQVDRQTFRPFAEGLVRWAEEHLLKGGKFSRDDAEQIFMVANLYELTLSPKMMRVIEDHALEFAKESDSIPSDRSAGTNQVLH